MMLFNRDCECRVNDMVFTTENGEEKGLTIQWSYDIKNYDEPGEMSIEIYNVSDEVISNINQLDPVVFSFGYDGRLETYFSGFLDTFEINNKGVDRVLKISCIEQDALIFKSFSISYNAGTTAKYIIEDLSKRSGLTLKQLELKHEKEYYTGYCVYGKPINEIRDIAKDSGSKIKIEGKDIYVYIDDVNDNEAVFLSYENGLLEEPQMAVKSLFKKSDDGEGRVKQDKETLYTHKVKSLAIPLIKKNSIIVIEGDTMQLTGQVIEISIDNYEAEYKVRKMDGGAR